MPYPAKLHFFFTLFVKSVFTKFLHFFDASVIFFDQTIVYYYLRLCLKKISKFIYIIEKLYLEVMLNIHKGQNFLFCPR